MRIVCIWGDGGGGVGSDETCGDAFADCVHWGEGAEAWAAMKHVESVVGQLSVPVTIIILLADQPMK